jgi:hypothetical protein
MGKMDKATHDAAQVLTVRPAIDSSIPHAVCFKMQGKRKADVSFWGKFLQQLFY